MTERDSDIPETAAARPAQTAPVVAVVLAAGFGTRFDPDNPKQLVSVGGKHQSARDYRRWRRTCGQHRRRA